MSAEWDVTADSAVGDGSGVREKSRLAAYSASEESATTTRASAVPLITHHSSLPQATLPFWAASTLALRAAIRSVTFGASGSGAWNASLPWTLASITFRSAWR